MSLTTKPINVLLVDDDLMDVKAVRRAFGTCKIANPITVARDGIEALEVLRGSDGKPPLPRPWCIMLDLNMPRMNGIEFLDELRADSELRDAVVFVLTTSGHDRDRTDAYQRNVAGYILKSNVGMEFLRLTGMLDSYWRLVELPE